MSRRLLLATRARHKVAELRELLDLDGVTLVTPDEVGIEGDHVVLTEGPSRKHPGANDRMELMDLSATEHPDLS